MLPTANAIVLLHEYQRSRPPVPSSPQMSFLSLQILGNIVYFPFPEKSIRCEIGPSENETSVVTTTTASAVISEASQNREATADAESLLFSLKVIRVSSRYEY